ncbi:MAG: thioredoxin family protein [Proteobacteria bacterium]|nr:thioredoxin family protein [Pseudomonadota bacterium]MCL2307955.1 thioredoxin family protein [Pseudomonadota bacterium]
MTCRSDDNPLPEHPTVYLAKHWPALQERRQSLASSTGAPTWLVVCLCAEWCAVCRDFRPAYHTLAQQQPDILFAYLDIEDDEALIGALELDDFPTLAIFRGDALIHFGVVKAKHDNIVQLLQKLIAAPPQPITPTKALLPLCNAVCRGSGL